MSSYYITNKEAANVLYGMKLLKEYQSFKPPNKLEDGSVVYGKITMNGELSRKTIEDCELKEV